MNKGVEILGKIEGKQGERELVPYYGYVSAGFPSPADDYQVDQFDLNELFIKNPAATYLARAGGQSMIGKRIASDDFLIVDRSINAKHGSIIIGIVNGEFTLKELDMDSGSYPILRAHNPNNKDIIITPETSFQTWGVLAYSVICHI